VRAKDLRRRLCRRRYERRTCVVDFADGDTGEGFASSALPMAIRARGDEDETPLPVTVASHRG
jgi:hypothetical protein